MLLAVGKQQNGALPPPAGVDRNDLYKTLRPPKHFTLFYKLEQGPLTFRFWVSGSVGFSPPDTVRHDPRFPHISLLYFPTINSVVFEPVCPHLILEM